MSDRQPLTATRRVYRVIKIYYARVKGKEVLCIKAKGELNQIVYLDATEVELLPPNYVIA